MLRIPHYPTLILAAITMVSCSNDDSGSAKSKIHAAPVSYDVDGVTCKGYLAYDEAIKGKRPGILVVHEWWGHNEYTRQRAEQLAKLGYTALALDMYGDGKQAEHPEDAQKFMMEVMSNMDAGVKRFNAAKDLLAKHETTDPAKIAAIGYCFGGAVVLHMARIGTDLAGVASFHGNLATKSPAKKGAIKAKILVCHGADDALVPKEQVEAFMQEMAAAGADMQFKEYAGAKHGFTNPGATAKGEKFKIPLAYNERADQESWAKLKDFLAGLWK